MIQETKTLRIQSHLSRIFQVVAMMPLGVIGSFTGPTRTTGISSCIATLKLMLTMWRYGFKKALRRCWTCSSFHTPPLRFVHSSALLSQSARGAQQVAIVEYSQDGRQFMSRHRTILAEVIVISQSRWMLATSKAMFVERRGNFFQILRALQEIGECQQPDVICYGFQNGVYKPLRALIDVVDGDFLQVQILREDPPHPDARQLLDESPTPSVCSTCSDSEELLRNPSKSPCASSLYFSRTRKLSHNLLWRTSGRLWAVWSDTEQSVAGPSWSWLANCPSWWLIQELYISQPLEQGLPHLTGF